MKIVLFTALSLFAITAIAQDSTKSLTKKDTLKIGGPDYDVTFTKVEVESEYPGGQQAWFKFLSKTLHYPQDAVNREIQGKVIVLFIVDTSGNVSNIKAISGPETGGLREEAERVIRVSGKWVPAMQNGRKVKSYKKQPFAFQIGINR